MVAMLAVTEAHLGLPGAFERFEAESGVGLIYLNRADLAMAAAVPCVLLCAKWFDTHK